MGILWHHLGWQLVRPLGRNSPWGLMPMSFLTSGEPGDKISLTLQDKARIRPQCHFRLPQSESLTLCRVHLWPEQCSRHQLVSVLLWPNQNFPPRLLESKFAAENPALRMGRFGWQTYETADLHNSAIYACHNTSSVVQQQQVITIARKESDLPGYIVTLSWLLCVSVQSVRKDEMKLPSQHVSIHPKMYSNKLAWNRWGQMVKLHIYQKTLSSYNCYYSKFPNNISFAAEPDFVLFGNINHNEQALKYQKQ